MDANVVIQLIKASNQDKLVTRQGLLYRKKFANSNKYLITSWSPCDQMFA
jgi:hypothetical protein